MYNTVYHNLTKEVSSIEESTQRETAETVQWAIARGLMLNTVGSADGFLMQGANIALEKTREALSKAK